MRRIGHLALIAFEFAIFTALIVATRCANYQDVFVAGNVHFVDADCYARMTRAQMINEKPGLIIRHHAFENFQEGTIPHTTAPLDYLIVVLSFVLGPFTAHALDLAGAFVSPLVAIIGGWFLWWWSRRMKFRYRWAMLILYAISPILVHGTELGRPDHQSLPILLVAIAICAEWSWQDLLASTSPDNSNLNGGPAVGDAMTRKLQTAAPSLPSDAIRESRMPSRVGGHERCVLGAGDLGFGLRTGSAVSHADGRRHSDQSQRGFRARSSRRMDFVRSDNCDCIGDRAARSIVRDPAVRRAFEKLGEHHWRARACVTDESSLVELVRVPPVAHAGFDLDWH